MTDETTPAHKEKTFNIRLDEDLYEAAMDKAELGLAPVIRALLRSYVAGDIILDPSLLYRELSSAPRIRRKPRQRKTRQ